MKRDTRVLFAFVMAALFLSLTTAAAAKPTLVIADPLQLRLNDRGTSFLISSSEGVVHGVTVRLRELKAPDGIDLDGGDVAVVPEASEITMAGVRVNLNAKPGKFAAAGDYKIAIYAEGTIKGNEKTQVLRAGTLTRLKPEISAPTLKDTTIFLWRPMPLTNASDSASADVFNAGLSLAPVPTFSARILPAEADVTAAPGKISVKSAGGPDGEAGLPPGFSPHTLHLDKFPSTGTFPATLLISVAGGGAPVEVPFKVVVTDQPFVPLLFIAAGVSLALIVQIVANKLQPRAENRVRALELAATVSELRRRTGDPERTLDVDSLDARLREADRLNDDGATANAKTVLDSVGTDAETLRKTLQEDQRAAATSCNSATEAVAKVEKSGTLEDDDRGTLQQLRDRIVKAGSMMVTEKRYVAAKTAFAAIESDATVLAQTIAARPKPAPGVRHGRESAQTQVARAVPFLRVEDPYSAHTVGRELTFLFEDPDGKLANLTGIVWDFGDGSPQETVTTPYRTRHPYQHADAYTVTASARRNGDEVAKLGLNVAVSESPAQQRITKARGRVEKMDLLLSAVAAVIAIVTGLWLLYAGKPFGSVAQYAEAFVWGFGIDNSVRGFAAVMKKVT